MASSELVAQILADQQGVGFSPRENVYGQIGGTLASALPQLVSPYASTKSNIATVLGGSLLAGLIGYQARQEAEAQNQVLMPALTGIVGAKTQQEVADIYGQLPSDMQSRLQSTALNRLGAIQERELAQEAAKQKLQQDLLVKAIETGRVDPSVLGLSVSRFPTKEETLRKEEEIKADVREQKKRNAYNYPATLSDLFAGEAQFVSRMAAATNSMTDLMAEIAPLTKGEFATEKFGNILKNNQNLKKKIDTLAIQITSIYSGAQMRLDEKADFKEFISGVGTDVTPEKVIKFMEDAVSRYRKDSADRISLYTLGDDRDTPLKQIANKLKNTPFNQRVLFDFNAAATTPGAATTSTATPTQEQLAKAQAILADPTKSEELKDRIRLKFGLE